MADPFSVIAGIIGVVTATAHTARRLREFLDSIKEGPENVRSIAKELGILQCSLIALGELLRDGDDFTEIAQTDEGARCIASLATILTHCQSTLVSIHKTVKPFTEKRDGSREHKWKTMAGWINRKDTLDSLKRELVSAKMTLDLGFSFATFLLTRTGISQLQNQFTQLNTRLEQEASEDNMSDVGSSSIVTDLGFALRRFLREPDTATILSNPFAATDGEQCPADPVNNDFSWRSWRKVDEVDFINGTMNGSRHKKGDSFDSKDVCPNISSPSDSPLTKRITLSSLEARSPVSPITSFNPSSRAAEQYSKRPEVEHRNTNPSSTHYDRIPEHLSLEAVPSGLYGDDAGWGSFQIPLKVFSNYFGLSFKKMMKKSPTSMLNFGIVTARPITNSAAYVENRVHDEEDIAEHSWDQINDPKLYRRSAPHWTLKIPGHKISGKPPTKGVSRVSLSKVVTNGASYEFIQLFIVAQKPENTTVYNFHWKPFCVFTYIGYPRRAKDIGMDDKSTEDGTKTIPDATPVSVWLAIKDEMLTFRLKSGDDKYFLNSNCAYWSMNSSLATD